MGMQELYGLGAITIKNKTKEKMFTTVNGCVGTNLCALEVGKKVFFISIPDPLGSLESLESKYGRKHCIL